MARIKFTSLGVESKPFNVLLPDVRVNQFSRASATCLADLCDLTKEGFIGKKFKDLVTSLDDKGFKPNLGSLVMSPFDTDAEKDAAVERYPEIIKQLKALPLAKSGVITFGEDKLNTGHLVDAFKALYSADAAAPEGLPTAGNCRWLASLFVFALEMIRGNDPKPMMVLIETRLYENAFEMAKDVARMNEDSDEGRQPTSMSDKFTVGFRLFDKGLSESDFTSVFVKRGRVQLIKEVVFAYHRSKVIDQEWADAYRKDICSGALNVSMTHTGNLRKLRLACERVDGNPDNKLASNKVEGELSIEELIEEHPDRAKAIIAYVDGVRKGVTPSGASGAKGLPKAKVEQIASVLPKGSYARNVLSMVAKNDAEGLAKAVGNDPGVKLIDEKGKPVGEYLTQEQVTTLLTEMRTIKAELTEWQSGERRLVKGIEQQKVDGKWKAVG